MGVQVEEETAGDQGADGEEGDGDENAENGEG